MKLFWLSAHVYVLIQIINIFCQTNIKDRIDIHMVAHEDRRFYVVSNASLFSACARSQQKRLQKITGREGPSFLLKWLRSIWCLESDPRQTVWTLRHVKKQLIVAIHHGSIHCCFTDCSAHLFTTWDEHPSVRLQTPTHLQDGFTDSKVQDERKGGSFSWDFYPLSHKVRLEKTEEQFAEAPLLSAILHLHFLLRYYCIYVIVFSTLSDSLWLMSCVWRNNWKYTLESLVLNPSQ